MFDHQQHIFPHENISLPRWCWLLLLVAGIFSSGCYPPVGTGDRTQPIDAASDQPSDQPWAATDGEVLPAVAVTDANGRMVEPVIQSGHHVPLQAFQWRYGPFASSDDVRIAFPREVHEVLPSIEGLRAEPRHWLESFILPTSGRWPLLLGHHTGGVMSPCGGRVAKRTYSEPGVRTLTICDLEQDVKLREVKPSSTIVDGDSQLFDEPRWGQPAFVDGDSQLLYQYETYVGM